MTPPASRTPAEKTGNYHDDRSPSMDDKVDVKNDPLGVLQKVPDPDQGLSEDEKRKLVSR